MHIHNLDNWRHSHNFNADSSSEERRTRQVVALTVVMMVAEIGAGAAFGSMPHAMQRLSIISPLNWGLTAFQDLLLRGASLSAVLDDLSRLMLFFAGTALLSWRIAGRRHSPS